MAPTNLVLLYTFTPPPALTIISWWQILSIGKAMTEEDTKQIADYDTYQKSLSDGFATALKVSQTEQASHYKLTLLRAKTTPLSTKTSAKFELILGPVEESHHPDTNVSDNRIWKDTVAMTEALGSRIGKVLNECMNSDFYHGVKTSSFCSTGGSWGRIDSFKADEDTSWPKEIRTPESKSSPPRCAVLQPAYRRTTP